MPKNKKEGRLLFLYELYGRLTALDRRLFRMYAVFTQRRRTAKNQFFNIALTLRRPDKNPPV